MVNEFFISIIHIVIILVSFLSIVYTLGIIWRVEKKIDLSYKLTLFSLLAFTSSEILLFFDQRFSFWLHLAQLALRALFIILFFGGILEMRFLLRKLDGEITKKN